MRRALTVTSADRLVSTLFLAGIVHALIILGITFDLSKPRQANKSLEIVLVRQSSERVPDKADFLAQTSSLGSGESAEKKKIEERGRPQQVARSSGQQSVEKQKQAQQSSQKKVLVQAQSTKKIDTSEKEKKEDKPRKISAESLAMQISELSKELNMAEQNYAKRPRIKFMNSMSAKSYVFAQYEAEWQRKIERIGNLNYPDEARRKRLAGRLLLVVLINSDGTLSKVELRSSSGHKVLDDAAVRIVQLAAPFAAFPDKISKEYDQLAITRTWRFASDRVSTK